jgi:hypothetical protein
MEQLYKKYYNKYKDYFEPEYETLNRIISIQNNEDFIKSVKNDLIREEKIMNDKYEMYVKKNGENTKFFSRVNEINNMIDKILKLVRQNKVGIIERSDFDIEEYVDMFSPEVFTENIEFIVFVKNTYKYWYIFSKYCPNLCYRFEKRTGISSYQDPTKSTKYIQFIEYNTSKPYIGFRKYYDTFTYNWHDLNEEETKKITCFMNLLEPQERPLSRQSSRPK